MAKDLQEYWRKNVSLIIILLSVWAVVSYGLGILLVVPLNTIKFGGFPLGFWFAQQGSEMIFVCLIFIYCFRMKALDKEYGVEE